MCWLYVTLLCGAVWCGVVQYSAVWYSVVQCVAVCCSALTTSWRHTEYSPRCSTYEIHTLRIFFLKIYVTYIFTGHSRNILISDFLQHTANITLHIVVETCRRDNRKIWEGRKTMCQKEAGCHQTFVDTTSFHKFGTDQNRRRWTEHHSFKCLYMWVGGHVRAYARYIYIHRNIHIYVSICIYMHVHI